MLGENTTAGQDAPAISEAAQPELAQDKASTSTAQTDGADVSEESPVVSRTYTEEEVQDRIERATAKAAAKAERRARREAFELMRDQPQQQQSREVDDGKPKPREGETNDSYIDRLTDWKLDQRDRAANAEKQKAAQQTIAKKTETFYAKAEELSGFDRDEFDALPLTKSIVETLIDSDVAPALMAYMSQNPEEVERISQLSDKRQAAEIGKIEAKLASDPPPKKVTSAPAPIKPIAARSTGTPTYDTTDPRSIKAMSTSEWIAAENARMRKRMEAMNR